MTKANVGKAIAIVLDGVVYSAPRVNGEIDCLTGFGLKACLN